MIRRLFAVAAVVLFTEACTPAYEQQLDSSEIVEPSWSLASGTAGSRLTDQLRGKAFDGGGRVRVCAAIASPGGEIAVGRGIDDLRRTASFRIGKTVVATGARFAPVYFASKLEGKPAACILTEVPWTQEYDSKKLEIRVQTTFRRS